MRKCKNCLLPEVVPGANINSAGICAYCLGYEDAAASGEEERRKKREADLEQALRDCRDKGEHDCLVPVSGGKDSIYLLYKLKVEYGLNVLAFTTDINIPDLAWANIKRACKKLDIPHLSYSPPSRFYTKVFRYLLQNQEERGAVYTISYVYAPLFEGDAIKAAMEKGIPLVLAGYSPGQPDPDRMFYEFSRKLIEETDWTPPGLKDSGLFSEEDLSCFFNPKRFPAGTVFPRYLAPFHAWPYSQERIMKDLIKLGLVQGARHANPVFTNYPINWLLMYSDLKHFGYNPYQEEFSTLIREGRANRNYWRIMTPLVNFMISKKAYLGRDVTRSLKWLEMDEKDLKVNRPKGAYDPA